MGFSTQETSDTVNISARAVVKGLIIALLTSFIFSFLLGAAMHTTSLNEKLTPLLTLILLGVSGFLGGCSAARVAGAGGLIHGIITGIMFMLASILIFSILLTGSWGTLTIIKKALVTILSASAGGIIGVATDR